jgi:hypothetical protein
MTDIDSRLRAAAREGAPERDLWPGVQARIRRSGEPRGSLRAAAVLIFLAGAAAGVAAERVGAPVRRAAVPDVPTSPLHAAADVQRAGSDYLAALTRLRTLESGDAGARSQGYEAALVVLTAAAEEVTGADPAALPAPPLVVHARQARDAASERVRALVRRGGR